MKEFNDIIQAYNKAMMQNKQTALVTVVKVEGSSYRRAGARMLVTEDGDITGAISGGCLEGDALRKARFAMFEQKNKMEIYDTTDDNNNLGVQLGCNGIVYILFEPINDADQNNPVNLLKKITQQRSDAVIVTAFSKNKWGEHTGTCCVLSDDVLFCTNDKMFPADALNILHQKSTTIQPFEKGFALYQFVPPLVQLIIVGAGNDAQPLVNMAALLGWNIVVVDSRPSYASNERFSKATKICITDYSNIASAVNIDDRTAIVLMTHNYNYDITALQHVVNTDCKYLGLLGPKKKLNKMLAELNEKGIVVDDGQMQNIYGPVGLDIGAETAEEIALSIVAEIKSVFSSAQGIPLKQKQTAIHNID